MNKDLSEKINEYGAKVDSLVMNRDYEGLKSLLDEMIDFLGENNTAKEDASFNYYFGTGLGTYADYLVRTGRDYFDEEVVSLRSTSMYHFRRARNLYNPKMHRDPRAKLRLLTNYANEIDTIGRVIEALRIYREILDVNEEFSIALGNYGRAISFLANMVNDTGHYRDLHCYAYQAIKKAINTPDPDMHEQAIKAFEEQINEYEESPSARILAEPIRYDEHLLGDDCEERDYRRWCLEKHLFLNPMNEVREIETAFAHDPLTITSYTEFVGEKELAEKSATNPPRWYAMLNQLKEEYVYARYQFYEGNKNGDVHFADKEVKLSLASYDYSNYSIRIEQIKSAYRGLYSMLDQISFFINDFWKLGLGEKQADAYHVYNAKNYPRDNIALGSLYWVLREFYETYKGAEQASEKKISILRNALEHKYVKVHGCEWDGKLQIDDDNFYHISEEDLKKYTMRMLQLCRESLIYLVYAIGIDDSKKDKSEKVANLSVSDFPDDWKL